MSGWLIYQNGLPDLTPVEDCLKEDGQAPFFTRTCEKHPRCCKAFYFYVVRMMQTVNQKTACREWIRKCIATAAAMMHTGTAYAHIHNAKEFNCIASNVIRRHAAASTHARNAADFTLHKTATVFLRALMSDA